jgi:hypothetical protein
VDATEEEYPPTGTKERRDRNRRNGKEVSFGRKNNRNAETQKHKGRPSFLYKKRRSIFYFQTGSAGSTMYPGLAVAFAVAVAAVCSAIAASTAISARSALVRNRGPFGIERRTIQQRNIDKATNARMLGRSKGSGWIPWVP